MGTDPTRISLTIELDSEEQAQRVSRSLSVDDDDNVKTEVDGKKVIGEVRAGSVPGARRAADDWLACLMAIVKE
ncbi:MAG: KEOPS complex subunit Pcc1 [Candidatus Thermoplasmatota archaeon]|nr:KEOPS complex subunit Pcc1 [Candidatus Thermoplasmatota archaeon]